LPREIQTQGQSKKRGMINFGPMFTSFPPGNVTYEMPDPATWWIVLEPQTSCSIRTTYTYVPAADPCSFNINGLSCAPRPNPQTPPTYIVSDDIDLEGDFILEEGATLDIGGFTMTVAGDVTLNGLIRSFWKPGQPSDGRKRATNSTSEFGVISAGGTLDLNSTIYIVVLNKTDLANVTQISYSPFFFTNTVGNFSLATAVIEGQQPRDCNQQNATMNTEAEPTNVLVVINVFGVDDCGRFGAGLIAAIVVGIVGAIVVIILIVYLASPSFRKKATPYKGTQES
jgi:hypothetical protein